MSERPYPPFSGDDATCPKCGGGMDKSYQPAGTAPIGSPPIGTTLARHGPEWLLRECFDCGYTWAEMCADATP